MGTASTIFITGTGRSGTNITKAIFEKHSQCAALPFEYRFTVDPGGVIDFINQYSDVWSPFMADKRLRALETYLLSLANRKDVEYKASNWLRKIDPKAEKITPFPYAGWELTKCFPGYVKFVNALMDQLVDYKYTASWPGSDSLSERNQMYFGTPKTKEELTAIFAGFLDNCFKSYLAKSDKEIFVEDNTWSLLYADDLINLVPGGKFLHIMRDPRDVISSLMNQRWAPSDLDQTLSWYKCVMSTWATKKNKLKDDQYLEVRLEDILNNTEKVIRNSCVFFGLEYEKSMSQIDLSKSNSGRYKTDLSTTEISKIENSLKDILSEYNY